MNKLQKHLKKVIISALTIFMIVQSFPMTKVSANEYVLSESLQKAVYEVLQVSSLTDELVSDTKELNLSNKEITDLSGIESFTNLERLNLDSNKIKDIKPVTQLHNLVEVSMKDQVIEGSPVLTDTSYTLEDLVKDESDVVITPSSITHDGEYADNKIVWDATKTLEEEVSYTFSKDVVLTVGTNLDQTITSTYSGKVSFTSSFISEVREEEKEPEKVEALSGQTRAGGMPLSDPNLIKAINQELGKGAVTTPIPDENEMASLSGALNLNNKGITNLDGLDQAINITSIDLTSNQLATADELDKISSLKVVELTINKSFADNVRELKVVGFEDLEEVIIPNLGIPYIKNITFKDLPSLKQMNYPYAIMDDALVGKKGKLTVENSSLTTMVFGYNASPKKTTNFESVSLKNLPLLEQKTADSIILGGIVYHWYWGIDPQEIQELEFIGLPKMLEYSEGAHTIPEVIGNVTNPNQWQSRPNDTINFGKTKMEKLVLNELSSLRKFQLLSKLTTPLILKDMPLLETVEMNYTEVSDLSGVDLSSSAELDLITISEARNGFLKDSNQLTYLESAPTKALTLHAVFSDAISEINIANYSNLETLKIYGGDIFSQNWPTKVKDITIQNIPSLKKISFNGTLFDDVANPVKGTLTLENLGVEDLMFENGANSGNPTTANFSKIVMKNLPNLKQTTRTMNVNTNATVAPHWYWGINPKDLKEVTFDNVGGITEFRNDGVDGSVIGLGLAPNNLIKIKSLEKAYFDKNSDLKKISLDDNKLIEFNTTNAPELQMVSVVKNKIEGKLNINKVPKLETLLFDENKIDDISNLDDILTESTSSSMKISGNKNAVRDASMLDLARHTASNFTVNLENQNVVSKGTLDVGVFGNLTVDSTKSLGEVKSPYTFAATNIKNGGTSYGNDPKNTNFTLNTPTKIQFDFASQEVVNATTRFFKFSGKADHDLNYPLKSFTGTLSSDVTSAISGDVIELELKYTAAGDTGFGHKQVAVDLPIPANTSFATGSVEVTDPNGLATDTVTWQAGPNKNTVELDETVSGTEYVIKYKVKVDTIVADTTTTTKASIGVSPVGMAPAKDSYAKIDVNGPTIDLKSAADITENHVNRLGTVLTSDGNPTTKLIPKGTTYNGVPQDITGYVYIGYQIGAGPKVFDKNQKPSIPNAQGGEAVTFIYGVADGTDEKTFDIVEQFKHRNGKALDPAKDDVTVKVAQHDDYQGVAPAVTNYIYLGYQKGSAVPVLDGTVPSITNVTSTETITYIYGDDKKPNDGTEDTFVVTELYEHRNGTSLGNDSMTIISGMNYPDPDDNSRIKSFTNYTYVGYKIGTAGALTETKTGYPKLTELEDTATVVFVYGTDKDNDTNEDTFDIVVEYKHRDGTTAIPGAPATNTIAVPADTKYEVEAIATPSGLVYAGHYLDASTTLDPANKVTFNSVTAQHKVVFLYGNDAGGGVEETVEITKEYRHRNGDPITGLSDSSKSVIKYTDFTDAHTAKTDYIYLGYILDNTGPIIPTEPNLTRVINAHTVTYVYGDDKKAPIGTEDSYVVTELFEHRNGTALDTDSQTITSGMNYPEPVNNGRVKSITGYTYIGFKIGTTGALVEDKNQYPQLSKVYDDKTVIFVYGTDADNDGKEDKFEFTENYVDRAGDPIGEAETKTTVPANTDYSKGLADLPAVSKYVYVGFILGTDALIEDVPNPALYPKLTNITANHEIKFVYGVDKDDNEVEDTIIVTEKFVDRAGVVINATPDNPVSIPERGSYKNANPNTFLPTYLYVGYRIDGTFTPAPALPEIAKVTEAKTVEIVYGKNNGGVEQTWDIDETYVDRNGIAKGTPSSKKTTKFENESHSVTAPTIPGYVPVEYYVDGSTTAQTTFPIDFNVIKGDHTVKIVYGVEDDQKPGHEKIYKVTEKHVNRAGEDITGAGFKVVDVYADTTYTGADETVSNYKYKKYTIDSTGVTANAPLTPSIPNIDKDDIVVFDYFYDADNNNIEDEFKVTQKYEKADGTTVHPTDDVDVLAFDKYTGAAAPDLTPVYIYEGYRVGNDPTIITSTATPEIDVVRGPSDITYIYRDGSYFTVTETYVNRHGSDITGTNDSNVVNIAVNDPYTNAAPRSFAPGYDYKGFRVNGGALQSGNPSIASVTATSNVQLVYGVTTVPGTEDTWDIVETYVDRNGTPIGTPSTKTTTKFAHESDSITPPTIPGYVFVEYYEDGSATADTALPIEFNDITGAHTVKFVYGVEDDQNPGHEKIYKVTEKHVNRAGEDITGAGFKVVDVYADTTYTGTDETVSNYKYKKYTIDSTGVTANAPLTPSIPNIDKDDIVVFDYFYDADNNNIEDEFKVTQKYETATGTTVHPTDDVDVLAFDKYTGAAAPNLAPVYVYVGYRVGSDPAIITSTPTPEVDVVRGNMNITYIYNDGSYFPVTETYVNRNGDDITGTNDFNVVNVGENDPYANNAPRSFAPAYDYKGFRVNGGALQSGNPSITSVTAITNVQLVYGVTTVPGTEDTWDIVETYVDRNGTPIGTPSTKTTTKFAHESESITAPGIIGYVFVEYYEDGSATADTALPINFNDITGAHTVKFVYGVDKDDNGVEDTFKVTEKHLNRNGDDLSPTGSVVTDVPADTTFTGTILAPVPTNYVYVGHYLKSSGNTTLLPGVPTISNIDEDDEVTYIYGQDKDPADGTEDDYVVTEKYQDRSGATLDVDTSQTIKALDKYQGAVAPAMSPAGKYVYVGYKIGATGTMVETTTTAPMYKPVTKNEDVTYVYGLDDGTGKEKKVTIAETHVDRNGDDVDTLNSVTLPAGSNFTGAAKTVTGFIYVGYEMNGGAFVAAPAVPNLTNLTVDQNIKYIYGVDDSGVEKEYTVTENYVDRNGDDLLPQTTDTVFARATYAKTAPSVTIPVPYVYVGYRLDNDATIHAGNPTLSRITSNFTISYVYGVDDGGGQELTHTINEAYVDRLGNLIGPMTSTTTVPSTTPYSKAAPLINGYVYLGYRLDGGTLQTGDATIARVSGVHSIDFVYGIADPEDPIKELKHTVTEKYVDRNGDSISADVVTVIPSTLGLTNTIKTEVGYIYIGYRLDNSSLVLGTPTISSVTQDHTIAYVYGVEDTPGVEKEYKVVEKFEHRNGKTLLADNTVMVFARDTYNGVAPSITKHVYVGFKVDGGDLQTGTPTIKNVKSDKEIVFVYGTEDDKKPNVEKEYDVNVHFMTRIGGEIHSTQSFKVPANTDYTFTPDVVKNYVYLGYKLDGGTFTEGVPTVTITDITKDVYLEFIYGVEDPDVPTTELVFNVKETYVDGDGKEIESSTSQNVIALLGYSATPKTVSGYDYAGYRIIQTKSRTTASNAAGGDIIAGTPSIESLNEYIRVEFVYNKKDGANPVTPKEDKKPSTGVTSSVAPKATVLGLSGLALLLFAFKRKKEKEEEQK